MKNGQTPSRKLQASPQDQARRDEVMQRVRAAIREDTRIKLPPFDPGRSQTGEFALHAIEENDFSGTLGPFRYQLEGEDDLLHLIVVRSDRAALSVEEGRMVAAFVLQGVPTAVIWLKPGELSQHFYVGHDELLT
jgi:hypothetical protein